MDTDNIRKEMIRLAEEAGNIILGSGDMNVSEKSGRRDLVTSKDIEIQKMLMKELSKVIPDCSFLCEENTGVEGVRIVTDAKEAGRGFCFIIDPIDGTANMVHGLGHSCTSVALAVDGATKIGVVHDPCRKETFHAVRGEGSYLNDTRLPAYDASARDAITVFGTAPYDDSNNGPTFRLGRVLYEISADVRRTGSAALDLCWTACGRFGLYAELSVSPWDFAAGRLIASETGCEVTDISGRELNFEGKQSILCGRPSAVKEFRASCADLQ